VRVSVDGRGNPPKRQRGKQLRMESLFQWDLSGLPYKKGAPGQAGAYPELKTPPRALVR
jgi:hypothetical protein